MYLTYHNLANFIIFFGLLTIPISFFFSKIVFLGIYIFFLLTLSLWALNKAIYSRWILFFLSLLYFVLSAMLRPEYSEVSFRLLTVILIIFTASFYSQKCESKDILKLANLTSVIGVLSAIYGLKQFLFGYSALETSLAISVGSIIKEFEVLGISRSLGITFDPVSQGILMGLTFHCLVLLNKVEKKSYIRGFQIIAMFLVILSLFLTLNRTTIVSFLLSLLIYINFGSIFYFFKGISGLMRTFFFIIFIVLILFILNLPEFDYSKRALMSVIEIFGIGDDSDEFFSRSQSLDKRLTSAESVGDILRKTPFGIQAPINDFSVNDIGFMSPMLKYGLIGGSLIISLLYLPLIGLVKFYFLNNDPEINKDIVLAIYASYLIIAISNISSFSLDGTIMMFPLWLVVFLGIYITLFNKKIKMLL